MQAQPSRGWSSWMQGVALLVAAGLAVWLLLQPALLSGLPLILRLPLMGLGIWALGAAFMRGLGLEAPAGWARRLASPPWCHGALAAFTLVLVLRVLML